jgi:hypothetical protein
MANKKFLFGMLAAALVLGMTVIGCSNGSTGGNKKDDKSDASGLNGTWVNEYDDYIKFTNGNYEFSYFGFPFEKGTYKTSGSTITFTPTQINGAGVEIQLTGSGNPEEVKWYSKAELKAYLISHGALSGLTNDKVEEYLSKFFDPYICNYSVSGNKLTLDEFLYGRRSPYTKK